MSNKLEIQGANIGVTQTANNSFSKTTAAATKRNAVLAVCLLPGLLFAKQALAAELEEIVVTAQKREQGVNDVGITVNAFSGGEIREMGVVSAEGIAVLTPGLTVNETAATGVPAYTIRGVGLQDYSTSASSTVGLYFDEVSMPYTVMSRGAIFDLERVEVLKGPQGDLYGRNTTAGQINFVSAQPTEEFEAGINVSYGSYKTLDAEGFVSGGLTDSMQGRFAFRTTQSSEGWQKSLTRDDELGEQDSFAFRTLLNIDINDQASLLLNVHYTDDQSDNKANTVYNGLEQGKGSEFSRPYRPLNEYILPGGAHFGEDIPWYSVGDNQAADWSTSYTSAVTGKTYDLRPKRDNQLAGMSAKLDWAIGEVTLTSITAYDNFQREETNDWDGGTFVDSSSINTTDLDVFSQELRLSGDTGEIMWVTGLYYSKDDMDEYYHYIMADSIYGNGSTAFNVMPFALSPILELDTKYSQETTSSAIFGHVEWSMTDKVRLTVGARYTEEERTWTGCTYVADDASLAGFLGVAFGANLSAGDCGTVDDDPSSPNYIFSVIGTPDINNAFHTYTDTINNENLMGKIGLDYSLTDDWLLYATVSRGYKSGGFNGANSNATSQLEPIKEERLDAFELGFKATLLDNSMQLNGAAFWYDYRDKQEQDLAVTLVGNISGLTNVPKSSISGAEFDMQWLPTDNMTIRLGAAYLQTEVKEWNAVDGDLSKWPSVVRRDVSGIQLAQSPKWQYNGMIENRWPIANDLVIKAAMDYSFQDSTTGGPSIFRATDSYWLLNARVGLAAADERWAVNLWGRNITDEYYFPAAYQGGNGPYVRSVGMPATYGVSVAYNF